MDILDNIGNQARAAMNDPAKKKEIEQLAKDKGITIEQAAKEYIGGKKNEKS